MIDLVQWRAMIGRWHVRQMSRPSFKSCSSVFSLSMQEIISIPFALLCGLHAIILQILLDSKQGIDQAISTLKITGWNALWWCSSLLIKILQRKTTVLVLLLAFSMIVQPILLIRAGDVERNPGPPKRTTSTQPPELGVVLRELGPNFVRWYPLGVFLGIDIRDLEFIRFSEQQKLDMQLIDMIRAWLKKTDATWVELSTALVELGEAKLADRISRKYCQKVQTDSEDDTKGESQERTTGTAIQQVQHIAPLPGGIDSGLEGLSEEQKFNISANFSFMFVKVVELLDKTVDPKTLSNFLSCLRHPLTGHPYIDKEMYHRCESTEDILKSLEPQFINSMHLKLLQEIAERFGCEETKQLVKQYNDEFPRFASLKRLGDPLSEEEIEACIGLKRVKVLCKGDADCTTKLNIESIQEFIEKKTGIDGTFIIYAKHSPGSIILVFLIPEVADDLLKDVPENGHGWTDFADSIILSIELDDFIIHLQDLSSDLDNTSSKHTEVFTPTPNAVKRVPIFETSEAKEWKENFAKFMSQVANELEKSIEITELKEYLLHFGHILYPESKYIDPQLLADAQTAKQILTALTPHFINFLNIQLLLQIADRFSLTTLKKHTILEYSGSTLLLSRQLNSLPDPISEEEIVELQGVDKLRVTSNNGLSNVTLHNVYQVQNALEKSTGIKFHFFVLANWESTANTHQFTFLVPKSISSIFWELSEEDLATLSECGAITIELNYTVLADKIQDYYSEKEQQQSVPPRRRQPMARARVKGNWSENTIPEEIRELLDMPHMQGMCSDSFLEDFSQCMTSWHDLAPYFGIDEYLAERIDESHDDGAKKHMTLRYWKYIDPSTATFKNLFECFYYRGHIQECEELLNRLVLQPLRRVQVRIIAEKLLQKVHIQKMSRHNLKLWPGAPDLVEFNRSFAQTKCKELKDIDYSKHYEMLEHFPSHTKIVSLKSFLNSVANREANFFVIKGPPASGKTLLMEKICAYWACNYALHNFDLVFHIDMKKYNRFSPTCEPPRELNLKDLIASQFHGCIIEDVSRLIEAMEGERTIFILDGCYPELFDNEDLQSWIRSRLHLKKAFIILTAITTTSPPTYYRQQEKYIQLDLLGLSEVQISKQALQSANSGILLYLSDNPNIRALTSYPVYLAAVIQVYSDAQHDKLPSTWTKLFAHLTLQLLRHAFPSADIPADPFHPDRPCIPAELTPQSVSMLPPEPHLLFSVMCTAACVGVQDATYAMTSPRIPMTILPEFFTTDSPCHYHFTMPLLQYFLAAFSIRPEHISHSSPRNKNFMVGYLWIFYAGLYPSKAFKNFGFHDLNIFFWCQGDASRLANCEFEAERAQDFPSSCSEIDIRNMLGSEVFVKNKVLTYCDVYHILHCVHGRTRLSVHYGEWMFGGKLTLKFESCYLGIRSIEEISKYLAGHFILDDCSTVQHLSMEDCQISDHLLLILAMGLKNGALQTLGFRRNKISTMGAIVLAEVLEVNPGLKSLDLAENNISDSGVGAIARAMATHQSLMMLSLHNNSISDKGVDELAKALESNQTLRHLQLADNPISTRGAHTIMKTICPKLAERYLHPEQPHTPVTTRPQRRLYITLPGPDARSVVDKRALEQI